MVSSRAGKARLFGMTLLSLAAIAPVHGQAPAWVLAAQSGPRYRDGAAMAFDAERGVVVLFGGHYTDGSHKYLNDTWTWDGTKWTQVSTTGPSPRYGHAMAYDASRKRVVLHGGSYYDGQVRYLGDTWEWNGSGWSLVSAVGAGKRYDHAMAYDPVRQRVFMFGGSPETGQQLDDAWEWNGSLWTYQADKGPIGRVRPSMAYDSVRSRIVLFGGDNYSYDANQWSRLQDTWVWSSNTTTWAARGSAHHPPARANAAMVFDPVRERIVLFGGYGGDLQDLGDTWEWNGSDWQNMGLTGPSPRDGHAMAYDSLRKVVVLFGGYSAETWVYGIPFTMQ